MRTYLTLLVLSLVLLLGCQGSYAPAKAPAKDAAGPNGNKDMRDVPALKAEIAQLQHELATGRRDDPYAGLGLINVHEHLYTAANADTYLAAARLAGVAATVFVASPDLTLHGKGDKGEPGMAKNFEEQILAAAAAHPGEVIPFCTMDPKDPDKLERLKKHVAMGAKGLKLYTGHPTFADGPIDDPGMEPVFAYAEQTGLPILWHINLDRFYDDFVKIMARHPKLNVNIAHYGVTFFHADRPPYSWLVHLLETYPNLFTDTSLGTRDILIKGFVAMESTRPQMQDLFKRFPKQILWGTDSVVTGNNEKTTGWYSKVLWATRDHLEQETFSTELAAGFSKYYPDGRNGDGAFQGLAIPPEILRQVYHDNAMRWLHLDTAPPLPVVTTP